MLDHHAIAALEPLRRASVGEFPEGAASSRSSDMMGVLVVGWLAVAGYLFIQRKRSERRGN